MSLPAESLDHAPFIFIVVSNFDHRSLEGAGMSNNATFNAHTHTADEPCFRELNPSSLLISMSGTTTGEPYPRNLIVNT
jgi:hypothetical protein